MALTTDALPGRETADDSAVVVDRVGLAISEHGRRAVGDLDRLPTTGVGESHDPTLVVHGPRLCAVASVKAPNAPIDELDGVIIRECGIARDELPVLLRGTDDHPMIVDVRRVARHICGEPGAEVRVRPAIWQHDRAIGGGRRGGPGEREEPKARKDRAHPEQLRDRRPRHDPPSSVETLNTTRGAVTPTVCGERAESRPLLGGQDPGAAEDDQADA